jgi:hypothetical protein
MSRSYWGLDNCPNCNTEIHFVYVERSEFRVCDKCKLYTEEGWNNFSWWRNDLEELGNEGAKKKWKETAEKYRHFKKLEEGWLEYGVGRVEKLLGEEKCNAIKLLANDREEYEDIIIKEGKLL